VTAASAVAPDELDLTVGPVAHGGHCVGRIAPNTPGFDDDAGRVVFVRHALPGERVRVRLTDRGKLWRGDAVEVLADPSADRVPSAWPEAGPDGVGGGELAHVSLAGQRRWKALVLAEQLRRLAGVDRDVPVEALGAGEHPVGSGLGYRTRISLVADDRGRAGMRKHRSHAVVPLEAMPLAVPELAAFAAAQRVWDRQWRPGARLELVSPSADEPVLLVDGEAVAGPESVHEVVDLGDGRRFGYRVAAGGFWQVHRDAQRTLVGAVLDAVGPIDGATVLDLYCGAGLFSLPLAAVVGPEGRLVAVEGSRRAAADAEYNLREFAATAAVQAGDVGKFLAQQGDALAPDVVVLDPPRSGAGHAVVDQIAHLQPRRVVYVACDPAALARDVARFAGHGYSLANLRAFDLFPMTHHFECVAVLESAVGHQRPTDACGPVPLPSSCGPRSGSAGSPDLSRRLSACAEPTVRWRPG